MLYKVLSLFSHACDFSQGLLLGSGVWTILHMGNLSVKLDKKIRCGQSPLKATQMTNEEQTQGNNAYPFSVQCNLGENNTNDVSTGS